MKRSAVLVVCSSFLTLSSVKAAHAADETFAQQFVGSPLLVLTAVMIVAALAFLYHRIRK
jgi:hypothetical protein